MAHVKGDIPYRPRTWLKTGSYLMPGLVPWTMLMARKVSIRRGLITEGEDSLKTDRQSLGREADTCL